MRNGSTSRGFWTALAVALGASAASLTHGHLRSSLVSDMLWREALRPSLIAVTLVALATAALLAYGDPGDSSGIAAEPDHVPARRSPVAGPALCAIAALSLLALLFLR